MGAIRPDKMPGGKTKHRKDGDTFTQYAKGGKVHGKKCTCKACGGMVK